MYRPESFRDDDPSRWRAIVEAHGFATLNAPRADGALEIAHLPFLLDPGEPHGTLRAHVARANPFAKMLDARPRVTVVFQGPHAYVSPRWYAAPRASVPTWNYVVVHAHGVARAIDDRAEARRAVADLTAKYEAGSAAPWTIDAIEAGIEDGLLGAIRAFAIDVET